MAETSRSRSSGWSMWRFLPALSVWEGGVQWPAKLGFALKAVACGALSSLLTDGEGLCDAVNDMRDQSGLPPLHPAASQGLTSFFDDLIPRAHSKYFFGNVLPRMADLAFRLPDLLKDHVDDNSLGNGTNLRVLIPQEPGIIFLSQELVAAVLACAFFCLYPSKFREQARLPYFNFDRLFSAICSKDANQEQKMICIVHYFSRVCQEMPKGMVSYERKVLGRRGSCESCKVLEPDENYWSSSLLPLCPVQVFDSGSLEDQKSNALEVDFANQYLGGGVLFHGCVQEEIRFLISPELIAGMLFMPAMHKNEAIEIIGAERFSCYEGYGASFRFTGDYIDNKPRDLQSRRATCIVAIDALEQPGKHQFKKSLMLREANKAFCGFLNHAESHGQASLMNQLKDEPTKRELFLQERGAGFSKDMAREGPKDCVGSLSKEDNVNEHSTPKDDKVKDGLSEMQLHCTVMPTQRSIMEIAEDRARKHDRVVNELSEVQLHHSAMPIPRSTMGIATGNWGCGAFGGNAELKSLLQWIAASQALRPFMHYYCFGAPHGHKLEQLTCWIVNEKWTVGELWGVLSDYGEKWLNGECSQGLYDWILPHTTENPLGVAGESSNKKP